MIRTILNFFFDPKPHKKLDEPPSHNYPTEVPPSLRSFAEAEDKAWEELGKVCKFLASIAVTCMVAWILFALSLFFQE